MFYSAQGKLEHFTSPHRYPGCSNCPKGTYNMSCKNCQVKYFEFEHVKYMECDCKQLPFIKETKKSFLTLQKPFCDVDATEDITNCNGRLKCGKCHMSAFYDEAGNVITQ